MKDTPCKPICAIDAAADCKVDQPNNYANCVLQYTTSCCCMDQCMMKCSPTDIECMVNCKKQCTS